MPIENHERLVSDEYRFSIEQMIRGSFVKYDRMDDIVFKAFSNTSIASATELNIFIDLYSIMHSMFSEHYRVDFANYTDITSNIINMCAHYRAFFKRLRVSTTFYLIFSTNCCAINRKYVSDYNEVFYRKSQIPESKKISDGNFKLLSALCPYLPDIHFIQSVDNFEVSVIIAHLIEMLNERKPNMIISKDIYPIQLTYLYPWTTFLYSRKSRKFGDTSMLVPVFEKPDYPEEFWRVIKESRNFKSDTINSISPVNYTIMSAIYAFPDRGLKVLHNIHSTIDLIKNMVGNEPIKISPAQLRREEIISKYNVELINARHNVLDVPFMLPYYRNSPECNNIKLLNLHDDAVINKINAKYFERNPIDLQSL